MEEIFKRLNNVFREVFDDESITVSETTVSTDIDGWDSLEHINLIVAIEEEFDIKFNMKEVTTMKNVGEMSEIIKNKLNN